jgi:hypothetical protein
MTAITAPTPQVEQVSGSDADGKTITSVLVKRTYRIDAVRRRCFLADEQLPLVRDIVPDPYHPIHVLDDLDLFPFKLRTDVVVKGHAWAPGRAGASWKASITVGRASKTIAVFGERRVARSRTGQLVFSPASSVEKVPLSYAFAYGGCDRVAEAKYGNPLEEMRPYLMGAKIDPSEASPYIYPRNRGGRGFLVEASDEAIEQLDLPQLEDPGDLLRPERMAAGSPSRWAQMPLPWCPAWLEHGAFPRVACLGVLLDYEPKDKPIEEVRRGFLAAAAVGGGSYFDRFSIAFANGASPGLQLPHLAGGTELLLNGLSPDHPQLQVTLPLEKPKISAYAGQGKLASTTPVMHSVVIEPEAARLSVVWRGSTSALRPYLDDELTRLPFQVDWA